MKKNIIGKWLIVVLPVLAALWLLKPTYDYYQLDADRQAAEAKDSLSLAKWDRDNSDAFQYARDHRLKLGLDLRGGMYATLEVDIPNMIEESVDPGSMDDDMEAILDQTRKEVKDSDLDVVDVFMKNMRAKGKSLVAYFPMANSSDVNEATIEAKLRKDANEAIDQALEVIKQRINKFDVSEVSIQKVGNRRIQLEMPDVKDEKEIRKLISETARLEFRRVMMTPEVITTILRIDQYLSGMAPDTVTPVVDTTKAATSDSTKLAADTTKAKNDTAALAQGDSAAKATDTSSKKDPYAGLSQEQIIAKMQKEHPLGSMIYFNAEGMKNEVPVALISDPSQIGPDATFMLSTVGTSVNRIRDILARREVRALMPADLDILVAAKPFGGVEAEKQPLAKHVYQLFGTAREAELTGEVIADANVTYDENNRPAVSMAMNSEGADRWAMITKANIKKSIAIVLDGRVFTAPVVQGEISGGSSQISGQYSIEEATRLAVVLKAGALKAPVSIIEERVVGPSLGEDSIRRGVMSSMISFAIVILFMLVYYAIGGGVADIALLMNILLVIAGMALFKGTLTLPGIAGLILSTAMAVDANILIFERIREELYAGRTLKAAVDQGFKKAWSAIFDSNITHLISSAVLMYFGTGPIRGFAVTLVIGVFMTVFTAVAVTRAIFEIAIASGATTFNFGQKKSIAA